MRTSLLAALLLCLMTLTGSDASLGAQEPRESSVQPLVLSEGLASPPAKGRRRWVLPKDSIALKIVRGDWTRPGEDEGWRRIRANDEGKFVGADLRGAYLSVVVNSDRAGVKILEAQGHSLVYVNGTPRVGDVYRTGWVRVPVALEKGENELLFYLGRGELQARLVDPPAPLFFSRRDDTVADAVVEEPYDSEVAVVVLNASRNAVNKARMLAVNAKGEIVGRAEFSLTPLGMRKIGISLQSEGPKSKAKEARLQFRLLLLDGRARKQDERELVIDSVSGTDARRKTFRSAIDGSVQYYAVRPAKNRDQERGMVLSVHGASVEAINQARSYAAKDDLEVVCATNRRPYGFDWEDWGRLDAMEVLDLATKRLGTDPSRTYLTGHSMGGHGSWHLSTTYPDRFAAVAPSAGWISMFSYAGATRDDKPGPVRDLLLRSMNGSDTLVRKRNLDGLGVYILHGDKDDNVPVSEARRMKKELEGHHPDLGYHEQPGAGHWWDGDRSAGADCVDWPEIFELFDRRRVRAASDRSDFEFTTHSPGMSDRFGWVSVRSQEKAMAPSRVVGRFDAEAQTMRLATENVRRIGIDVETLGKAGPLRLLIDGQDLGGVVAKKGAAQRFYHRGRRGWRAIEEVPGMKGPWRSGLVKEGFRHRAIFVYGTAGNAAENAWTLAKARYDAEIFYYRGNGDFEVVADRDFDPEEDVDRSVVLFGNADTNLAWKSLLGESPLQVKRGAVKLGRALPRIESDELCVFFIRPRPGSDVATVTVVGGTGPVGMRAADRFPTFVSGVGFPDFLIAGADVYERGEAAVKAAGFFGEDWSMKGAEIAVPKP